MKTTVIAAAALACIPLAASAQFEQLKGKVKPGMYEYKMTMEMAGMPKGMPGMPGMGGQPMTMQHCVKQEDIDNGKFGDKNNASKDCKVENFKMSGNTASYTMTCTGKNEMKGDTRISFNDTGFVMDSNMTMSHGGQPMSTKQHMESKYLGPFK
jgi:hypothetical protein